MSWMVKFCYLLIFKVAFAELDFLYSNQAYKVRLVGRSPLRGRLEVLYNDTWGTVCDDGFTNETCVLVCKQLGFLNGTCWSHDATQTECLHDSKQMYEEGTGQIWLDDVKCMSYEHYLSECPHTNWGEVNCNHSEDVGCSCLALNKCDKNRHRIVALDPSIRGVGIVEVQNEEGQWGGVCDDHWDDLDAAVFCRCLGYHDDGTSFKAMLMNHQHGTSNTLSSYNNPIIIDKIHCHQKDKDLFSNLYDCTTTVHQPSECNVQNELAIVRCENTSTPFNFSEDMQPMIECQKDRMQMCIQPTSPFSLANSYAQLVPYCSEAIQLDYDADKGFCYDINLKLCDSLKLEEDKGNFETCFDLKFHTKNHPFFFIESPSYRGCCVMETNKMVETHVVGTFDDIMLSSPPTHIPDIVIDSIEASISLACSDKNFESVRFTSKSSLSLPPIQMKTGSPIYCKVKADVWHDYSYLVVKNCRLQSLTYNQAKLKHYDYNNMNNKNNNGNNNNNDEGGDHDAGDHAFMEHLDNIEDKRFFPADGKNISYSDKYITYSYVFFAKKCPVTDLLNMELYNFDSLTWGFSIYLPKFHDHNNVHISCDASLCDHERAEKRFCDRSCDRSAGGSDGSDDRVSANMNDVAVISQGIQYHGDDINNQISQLNITLVEDSHNVSEDKKYAENDLGYDDNEDNVNDKDDVKGDDYSNAGLEQEDDDDNDKEVKVVKRNVNNGKYDGMLVGKNRFREMWGDNFGMVIKKRSVKRADGGVRRKKHAGKRILTKGFGRNVMDTFGKIGSNERLDSVDSESDDRKDLKVNGNAGGDNEGREINNVGGRKDEKEKKRSEVAGRMIKVVSPMIEVIE